jgi:hypothetical protein
MTTIDDEWQQYINNQSSPKLIVKSETKQIDEVIPRFIKHGELQSTETNSSKPYELYVSTKTKVLFLNQVIDIQSVFWNIPVIEYWTPTNGVVKKQMKIVSKTLEEYDLYCSKLQSIPYYTENIIKQINNPAARRIKFKDERKITIGISKKDIMNCRIKTKNAFYNCFAIIIRFKFDDIFREIHVKVFNTGKMEIPGILNDRLLTIVKKMILEILQPFLSLAIEFIENENCNGVLINSNFNCGYYINREQLYAILRNSRYGIESAYDPCSYPGVKSKFYFNNELPYDHSMQMGRINIEDQKMKMSELLANKKYTEVSFMIFRTGNCLIVGNCSDKILQFIFEFICDLLQNEKPQISTDTEEIISKNKKFKIRKKVILMSQIYYRNNISI